MKTRPYEERCETRERPMTRSCDVQDHYQTNRRRSVGTNGKQLLSHESFQLGGLEQVVAYTYPFDRVHDTYQEYYRASLIAALGQHGLRLKESTGSLFPFVVRRLQRIKESYRLNELAVGRIVAQSAHGPPR